MGILLQFTGINGMTTFRTQSEQKSGTIKITLSSKFYRDFSEKKTHNDNEFSFAIPPFVGAQFQ
jgi:hypothetical protein